MVLPPKRYTQTQLTKIFAAQSAESAATLKNYLWFNPTNDFSLRLTLSGYRFVVEQLKLQTYDYQLPQPLNNRNLLQLERYFPSIFYLINTKPKIVVFDEQEAAMLALYGNDLPGYLNSLEISGRDYNADN